MTFSEPVLSQTYGPLQTVDLNCVCSTQILAFRPGQGGRTPRTTGAWEGAGHATNEFQRGAFGSINGRPCRLLLSQLLIEIVTRCQIIVASINISNYRRR
jgi:hypothetical protein